MAKDSGDKMLKVVVYGIGIFFILYNLIAWLAPIAMLLKLEKLESLFISYTHHYATSFQSVQPSLEDLSYGLPKKNYMMQATKQLEMIV